MNNRKFNIRMHHKVIINIHKNSVLWVCNDIFKSISIIFNILYFDQCTVTPPPAKNCHYHLYYNIGKNKSHMFKILQTFRRIN